MEGTFYSCPVQADYAAVEMRSACHVDNMRKSCMMNEVLDARLTRPVSLGLRARSSDGFKATLPYVTHHHTVRSAVRT